MTTTHGFLYFLKVFKLGKSCLSVITLYFLYSRTTYTHVIMWIQVSLRERSIRSFHSASNYSEEAGDGRHECVSSSADLRLRRLMVRPSSSLSARLESLNRNQQLPLVLSRRMSNLFQHGRKKKSTVLDFIERQHVCLQYGSKIQHILLCGELRDLQR